MSNTHAVIARGAAIFFGAFATAIAISSAIAADTSLRVLVKPILGGQEQAVAIWNGLGFRQRGSIPQLGIYVLDVPRNTSMNVAVSELSNTHAFALVEEDKVMRPDMTPNDPDYPSQWGLPKVGFDKAWNKTLGSGITIAIVDTGVNCSLQDFSGQCVPGWNVVDNNGNTNDDYGHGTGVASIAGAAINNGYQIAGAAPGAKIMPIKFNQDGTGTGYNSDAVKGIMWAADNGARVVNLSWGSADDSQPSYTLQSAAFYLRQKGGILFESAGNHAVELSWPDVSVIDTTGATDETNNVASFSNYGKPVDFMAPGADILQISMVGTEFTTSGTSASAPLAASVAALMLSANPSLLPWQAENIMWYSASRNKNYPGRNKNYGGGIIDTKNSIANVFMAPGADTIAPDPGVSSKITTDGTAVTFDWLQGFDNTGPVSSYNVYRATTQDGKGAKIGKTSGLEFVDKNPLHGQQSYYWVRSVDGVGLASGDSYHMGIFVP